MIEGLHQVRIAGGPNTLTHGIWQLVLVGDVQDREVRIQFAHTSGQLKPVCVRQDDLRNVQAIERPVLVELTPGLLSVLREEDPAFFASRFWIVSCLSVSSFSTTKDGIGGDMSSTHAQAPGPDQVVPNREVLDNISTDHLNGRPWVMWPNTPYAHIMIPLESRGQ